MSNRNRICILSFIFMMIGVFIMPGFFGNMTKNIIDHIKYRETYVDGEIVSDNDDGTYDVKINNASSAFPNVETRHYGAIFSVGEIVDIGYLYGNKESPRIMGHSKKIPQEPYESEVDYSGGGEDGEGSGEGEGGGKVTKTVTVYSTTNDGTINNYNADYTTCHNAASGYDKVDGNDSMAVVYCYANFVTPPVGLCHCFSRSFIFFDTSEIPSGANITSAILYLRKDSAIINTAFKVVVQDGQPTYPHSTLVLADYLYSHYKNNGGEINAGSISDSAYTAIPLNSNGRNWVNQGGITKLCLRNSRDIAGIEYTGAAPYYEMITIWASEKGTGYKPKLVITYEI